MLKKLSITFDYFQDISTLTQVINKSYSSKVLAIFLCTGLKSINSSHSISNPGYKFFYSFFFLILFVFYV